MKKLLLLLLCFIIYPLYHSQAQFILKNAFPNLTISQPIELISPNDQTNRIFVASQVGIIYVFPNNSAVTAPAIFLDISAKVIYQGERGLLGITFHPNYKSNGFIYTSYNRKSDNLRVISRFKVSSTNTNQADPASETVLLTYAQPYTNHNGGKIAFGNDGYLYIATGDGGSGGDPFNYAQNRAVMLGKILRIDVNRTSASRNYAIPSDNPYVTNTQGYLPEIYAYGLRNPWKFSIDQTTGRIWAGDVGQNQREEVNIIVKNRNYGWKVMEGNVCYPEGSICNPAAYTAPIHDYDRSASGGTSITGGYVYRGKIPYLYGKYIYGDFASGNIWTLTYNSDTTSINQFLVKFPGLISSFGEDQFKELYICNYATGEIFKITDDATVASFIVFPSDGTTNVTHSTVMANAVPGASSYTIELNTKADFTGVALVKTSSSHSMNFAPLTPGQLYYVRVKTNLSANWGRTTTFTTGTIEAYTLVIFPSNGTTNVTHSTVMANAVPGASSYTIELNTKADFTGVALVKTSSSHSMNFAPLTPGQLYYVRVKTNLSANWGRTTTFTTGTIEAYTLVIFPSNGTTNVTHSTVMANAVPGASSYTIELNTKADFTGVALAKTSSSHSMNFAPLTPGQLYYVRVKTNLSTNWGRTTTFTTAANTSSIARIASNHEDSVESMVETQAIAHVYPNPFTSQIILQISTSDVKPVTVQITDLQGRLLYGSADYYTNQKVELGQDLLPGVYILRATYEDKSTAFRIVKIR